MLAYFGFPQAREHDAERAVRAGLALVEAAPKLEAAITGTNLHVRVGIATGLVVVGDLQAEPNTVIIAGSTRRLLGNLFELQDLGAKDLKGIAGLAGAWAVVRASSVESRLNGDAATRLTSEAPKVR